MIDRSAKLAPAPPGPAHLAHTDYYLDESGNTGDLTTVTSEAYFTEQRMFALAALGCTLDDSFRAAFDALKTAHRVQSADVKAKQVYHKPRFLSALLELLEARGCPLFIEAVDKHYFVVMHIIERMVMPYVGDCDTSRKALWMKSVMADHMAVYAPPEIAHAFASCCQSRDHTEIRDLYKRIIAWGQQSRGPHPDVAAGIVRLTRDSLKDFRKLPKARAVERALPVPDTNPAGKLIWVLPNLSSFTHIYARINRFAQKRVAGITLFHDEQLQFGDILQQSKDMAEALNLKLPLIPADFEYQESADLRFLRSQDSIGIQIADILAGFVARYVEEAIWGETPMHPEKMAIFERLVTMGDQSLGTGINFVAPTSLVRMLGIVPQPNV
ncbi:DUF3800 domain-containing protein [Sphingopyxis sp. PAMC25046]|nr:DUF3800 domain-containing protein [Sphingopyxis sp. PAMC25046]